MYNRKYFCNSKCAKIILKFLKEDRPVDNYVLLSHWLADFKTRRPIWHSIIYHRVDAFVNFVMLRNFRLGKVKRYCINRFIKKTHLLPSTLKRGWYHDYDSLLTNSLFEMIVQYVEVTMASEYQRMILCADRAHRSSRHGVAWLNYVIRNWDELYAQGTYAYDYDNLSFFKDMLEIYLYVKNDYPNRDIGDLYEFQRMGADKYGQSFSRSIYSKEEIDTFNLLYEQNAAVKLANDNLEEYYMIRIIQMRAGLWQ